MSNDGAAVTTLHAGRLTVCTYGGFAPVCFKDADGNLVGLDVSFLTRFAESEGLALDMIDRTFDGIWALPDMNVCDIAAAGITKLDSRYVGEGASWSDAYFQVNRSLLVRSAEQLVFDDHASLVGKKIVVTRGSTADIDAQTRYPDCTLQYVDEVAMGQQDQQEYVVKTLLADREADAFGEGDVSNRYLRDTYGKDVEGGLVLADIHPIDGPDETFSFVARNASTGLLERLNAFIAANKDSYASKA